VESLKREIENLIHNRRIFTSRMRPRRLRALADKPDARHNESIDRQIAAFCAIGNPRSFTRQLQAEGYDPLLSHVFPDHHKYNQAEVSAMIAEAKAAGAKSLITTSK